MSLPFGRYQTELLFSSEVSALYYIYLVGINYGPVKPVDFGIPTQTSHVIQENNEAVSFSCPYKRIIYELKIISENITWSSGELNYA